jgi:predicted dehydrogenase
LASKHRIGIIGCGWFADFHLNALRQLDDRVDIVWAADVDEARAERVAKIAQARALTDYADGLADVDAVHILLPHHLHHPVTLACLEAGKHVLLEKPIAISVAEADEMIAAADAQNRTLMIAYPHRYRPCMQIFREHIESGDYGRLFMLDAQMDEQLPDYIGGWIANKSTLGGGVFFSASPHMLDVMLWISGDVRSMQMVGTRASDMMEGEDTAASIIAFESGVIGVTRHTWASPAPAMWYTMTATCERGRITLTTNPVGNLVNDGPRCLWETRIVLEGPTPEVLLESDEGLDLKPEVEHFLDCIESGVTPQTDGRSARRLIELVYGAYADAEARGALGMGAK